jgi:threonine synthase
VRGDFDMAMELLQRVCAEMGIYLVNSINPFRIEGQKSIAFEMLQQLGWDPPDWVVLPAGNLGNTAAIGKALLQARDLGLIKKMPRVASVQASGANPFYRSFQAGFAERFSVEAHTVASAIKIGAPVSYARARRVIRETKGVVTEVEDPEILEAKAVIDAAGIGCEPASAASLAGARRLVEQGVIGKSERVVCILTGNLLKDPDATISYHMDDTGQAKQRANRPIVLGPDPDDVRRAIESYL